jgi:hypothetical protein
MALPVLQYSITPILLLEFEEYPFTDLLLVTKKLRR